MVSQRIFLALSALVWLPYGVLCFAEPSLLGEVAGVLASSSTGTTEVRAMYGGLQAAIGALALGGVLCAPLRRPALLMLAALCAGLATARLSGVLLDGGLSVYTVTALVFEIGSSSVAVALLSGTAKDAPS